MIVIFIDIPTKIQKIVYKKQYSEYVTKYANEYNIDENLIYAVIKAESNFKNDAKSSKDAMGLMQLMKDTAKEVSQKINLQIDDDKIEQKLLDVEININLGTKYLSDLIDRYQNIELAVTAYNAGIGTVNNWIEKGSYPSSGM